MGSDKSAASTPSPDTPAPGTQAPGTQAPISLGGAAPAFTLQDQSGNSVSLKDFKGSQNVVLYFYPKAMTPGCTVQACGLRDSSKQLAGLDAVALGISPDPVGRLKKFEQKENLNFTLLADEDHAITEKYGVWGLKKFMGREYMGVKRSTFIIDKQGKVAHVMDKVKTKSHHSDVLAVLQTLAEAS
jgi:peroxiredoxin Q/BCP